MNNALLHLLHITDPSLPIGAYAHSGGLETYVQAGLVHNKASAEKLVVEILSKNIFYTDAALLSLAYDAAMHNHTERVLQLDAACTAVKLPYEIRNASIKLGARLLKLFHPLCSSAVTQEYQKAITAKQAQGHYCLVFGLYAQALHIPKEQALSGFYYNTAAGLITNCVKLVPLGQQEGQELLFSLLPLINRLAAASMQPDEELIGVCSPGLDIRCMQHEQLYSRLYMS